MSGGRYFMYVGTFTHQFKIQPMGAPADGIGIFSFDAGTGAIEHIGTIGGLFSPTWLAFHPTLPVLYAVERRFDVDAPEPGALASYEIDESTGHLTQTSRAETEGRSPPHVSIHPSGRHAYCTHFESGHVVGFPLDEKGRVGAVDTRIEHKVEEKPRDGAHHHLFSPHPHQSIPAANGKYITVSDVGTDDIRTYPTDPETGKLADTASYRSDMPKETGPRHHAVHPSGKFIVACGEANDSVNVLRLDEETGQTKFLGAYSALPDGYVAGDNHVGMAEIVFHPSGRAFYASNRGPDCIAVYGFDPATGKAEFKGAELSQGDTPRAFTIDPTGAYMIIANQAPGSLVQFRIDPETFWPHPTGLVVETPSPVCIRFRERRD